MDGSHRRLLERLWSLSRNLWWVWQPGIDTVFQDIDSTRWSVLQHNPVALLQELSEARLLELSANHLLRDSVDDAYRQLQEYRKGGETWGNIHAGALQWSPVAYFSAEFGLHESLRIYSGGLGVLAGDHLKAASDLGIPMVGIGLLYRKGYFRQRLDRDGWQHEDNEELQPEQLPLDLVKDREGKPLEIAVETGGQALAARVWRLAVGRNSLLLLDSDVEQNNPADRELTSKLYGGDARTRIRQELLLGVGGARALHALGIRPAVIHLNEGHSAFATLELVRMRMRSEGVDFQEAMHRVSSRVVFTMHTPVPAGHDRFDPDLVEEHLGDLRRALGIERERLLGLGRVITDDPGELFCMSVLGIKLSEHQNGVSALHGQVNRQMWHALWPHRKVNEIPMGHITNGVHVLSWLAPPMRRLYDRHFPPKWADRTARPETWAAIRKVGDAELWETHQLLKSLLIDFVRRRATDEAERRGDDPEVVHALRGALHQDVLLVGFGRRFASYKRATLLLTSPRQLDALVNHADRPIHLVFSGKAHPRDEPGKRLLQEIHRLSRMPQFLGKIVVLENYDMNVARHLVQGVDVWLNNPRRPEEASGTSGQKVVLNGGLNCSIIDGWWAEAYDGENGFAIGTGEAHRDPVRQDLRDAEHLYETLRSQVVPLYYEGREIGMPVPWIRRIKRSIRTLGWRFNADRMVIDYARNCYLPAAGGTSCLF